MRAWGAQSREDSVGCTSLRACVHLHPRDDQAITHHECHDLAILRPIFHQHATGIAGPGERSDFGNHADQRINLGGVGAIVEYPGARGAIDEHGRLLGRGDRVVPQHAAACGRRTPIGARQRQEHLQSVGGEQRGALCGEWPEVLPGPGCSRDRGDARVVTGGGQPEVAPRP